MDRKHGKRPLPPNESEKKEEEVEYHRNIFPVYSSRSQQDDSAMVSALTQVIGNTTHEQNPLQVIDHQVLGNPQVFSAENPVEQSQPAVVLQAQGIKHLFTIYIVVY